MSRVLVCRRIGVTFGVSLAAVLGGSGAAQAQTVTYTIHVPALVLTNLCHDDEPVNVSGDLKIRIVTTRDANGNVKVVSKTIGDSLRGTGVSSGVAYRGVDGERSQSYVNPSSALPTTSTVKHFTRLFPKSSAINPMYLVIILREVVAPTGAAVVPTLQHMDLTCHKPTHCGKLKNAVAVPLDAGELAALPE